MDLLADHRAAPSLPVLGVIVDRTSFDETDDYGVDHAALEASMVWKKPEEEDAVFARVMKNGRVRRRLRWRPKSMLKQRKQRGGTQDQPVTTIMTPQSVASVEHPVTAAEPLQEKVPPQIKTSSSNASVASAGSSSQESKTSRRSVHSFASVETMVKSNKRLSRQDHHYYYGSRKYRLPRPNYPTTFDGIATIGTEGEMLYARMRSPASRLSPSSATSPRFTSSDMLEHIHMPLEKSVVTSTIQEEAVGSEGCTDSVEVFHGSPDDLHTAPLQATESESAFEQLPINQKNLTEPTPAPLLPPPAMDGPPTPKRSGIPPLFRSMKHSKQKKRYGDPTALRKSYSEIVSGFRRAVPPLSTSSVETISTKDTTDYLDEEFPLPSLSGEEVEGNRRVDLRIRPPPEQRDEDGLSTLRLRSVLSLPVRWTDADYEHASPSKLLRKRSSPRQSQAAVENNAPINCSYQVESETKVAVVVETTAKKDVTNLSVETALTESGAHKLFNYNEGETSEDEIDEDVPSSDLPVEIRFSLSEKANDEQNPEVPKSPGTPRESREEAPNDSLSLTISKPSDLDQAAALHIERNLQAIHEMGTEHLKQGEFDEALDVFEEILRGQLARYGENHFRVGTAHHNIGIVYMKKKDYASAIKSYREAVRIRKRALDPYHQDVAVSLAQLGVAYLESRKFRKSIGAFREALKIRRKCFGNTHPKVAKILNNIGCALYELNELGVAQVAFEEALAIQRDLLRDLPAESHGISENWLLGIATTQCNIASIRLYVGEYEEATLDLEEALLIQQCVLGDDHPMVKRTFDSLIWLEATRNKAHKPRLNTERHSVTATDTSGENLKACDMPETPVALRKKGQDSATVFDALERKFMSLHANWDLSCGVDGNEDDLATPDVTMRRNVF